MAQIIIPQYISGTDTGTLSGIARQYKTDIPTLQRLNPQITDINQIQAGATFNIPDVKKTTDISSSQIINSSDLARNQFNKDLETLPKIEGEFTSQPLPEKPAGEVKTEQPVIKPEITIKSSNLAFQSIIDQTNETLRQFKEQGGTLTPELTQQLSQINSFQAQKTMAVANAREAADIKDATKLNEELTKAKEIDTATKTAIDTLRENLKTARESYISALKPTEAETELKRKLNTLRTERKLLPLELRREGISAAGIAGRQVEDERVRAIQEGNLLMEIGLEQEARQFATTAKEKQVDWISKDIELQTKIDDKIKEDAKNVLKDARELRKDSLSAMSDILSKEGLGGLAWEDLDTQSQADLIETAKQFNIPLNLLTRAMANVKQQKVFDNALKTTQEARLGKEKEKDKEVKLTPENKRDLAGAGYTPQDISDIERSVNDFGIKATLKAIDDENKRAIVAEKYNAQIILDEIESEIEAAKPKSAKKWYEFWK